MRYKITRTAAYMASQENQSPELKHYGVKGMKWGEKKFGKGPGLDDRYRNDEELARAARAAQPTRPQTNTTRDLSRIINTYYKGSLDTTKGRSQSAARAKPKVSDALLERVFGSSKTVNRIHDNNSNRSAITVKTPGLFAPVVDAGEQVGAAARRFADTTGAGIVKTAKKAGSDIGTFATNAYNDAKKWVDGAIGTIGNTAVKVGDTAKSAYNDAKKWVDGLFSKTESVERGGLGAAKVYKKGGIEKAYDSAKAGITKTATQVGDAAKTFVDNLIRGENSTENTAKRKAAEKKARQEAAVSAARRKGTNSWVQLQSRKGPLVPDSELTSRLYTDGVPSEMSKSIPYGTRGADKLAEHTRVVKSSNAKKQAEFREKYGPSEIKFPTPLKDKDGKYIVPGLSKSPAERMNDLKKKK